MACLNNSLVKHVDELKVLLAQFSFDILANNETKLDESIKSSELHVPGYEFIRRDRNKHGGGESFYIKSSNSFIVRSDLNVINLKNLTIEIRKPSSKPFLVTTWYRPPCSPTDLFSSYESFKGNLDSLDLEYYLLGDSDPLFKQGESFDLNNYRPISVISVVAKVFEGIVYDQLYNFLNSEEIISRQQSGFRSLHSTVTALREVADSWPFNIDRGYVNGVVFLDLKKAFDTVDHEILPTKMNRYGIQGKTLVWFKSYTTVLS